MAIDLVWAVDVLLLLVGAADLVLYFINPSWTITHFLRPVIDLHPWFYRWLTIVAAMFVLLLSRICEANPFPVTLLALIVGAVSVHLAWQGMLE